MASNASHFMLCSRYIEKFGFTFVICSRLSNVDMIVNGLQERYGNSMEDEIRNGIEEVKKITRLRLTDNFGRF